MSGVRFLRVARTARRFQQWSRFQVRDRVRSRLNCNSAAAGGGGGGGACYVFDCLAEVARGRTASHYFSAPKSTTHVTHNRLGSAIAASGQEMPLLHVGQCHLIKLLIAARSFHRRIRHATVRLHKGRHAKRFPWPRAVRLGRRADRAAPASRAWGPRAGVRSRLRHSTLSSL